MSAAHVPAELRRAVRTRARHRCEYCLAPEKLAFQPHQMEHITAQKHGGATDAENLALSCVACNQFKGTDLTSLDPETGAVTPLFHPRRDRWREHFGLRGLFIMPKTPAGRATVRLLQFNTPERITEREWFAAAGELAEPTA